MAPSSTHFWQVVIDENHVERGRPPTDGSVTHGGNMIPKLRLKDFRELSPATTHFCNKLASLAEEFITRLLCEDEAKGARL